MAYDNTNRGILSKNDRKEQETHPDFTGQINVAGVDYWLNGWVKTRNDGSGKFFSLSVKPKDAPRQAAAPKAAPSKASAGGSGFDDMDDDIPW